MIERADLFPDVIMILHSDWLWSVVADRRMGLVETTRVWSTSHALITLWVVRD